MGMGKSALNEIIKKSKDRGNETLFLCVIDTNINAIAFYKKLRFVFHSKTILDILYDESVYGTYRVFRGGGWCDQERSVMTTTRRRSHPLLFKIDDLGFRIVKNK